LHPDVFGGARFIESELINYTLRMFKGDQECCGISTFGGSESTILSLYAYKIYALETKGIKNPEL
jgi:sphinganine-1-phosphate aldolase